MRSSKKSSLSFFHFVLVLTKNFPNTLILQLEFVCYNHMTLKDNYMNDENQKLSQLHIIIHLVLT